MDKKTLAKKLAALSTEGETFEGGFRVVSDGVEPPILAAILNEVDLTVLPRKLAFRMDNSEITLVAGGRRLRGLVKASKDIKGVIGVLGKPLTRDDAELLAGLHEIIGQFTATAGKLTVESSEPDAMGGQADAGLTAQILAEIWGVDLNIEPATPVMSFIRGCGAMTTAWVIMTNDSENKTGGDGAKLAALKAAISQQWAQFSNTVDDIASPSGFICLNNALGDMGSVAIIKTADEAAMLCYDDENMSNLHSQWANSAL